MKLLELKATNLFSYKDLYIDFTKFGSGIVLIEGIVDGDSTKSNGAGKSTIPEIISWILFDSVSKASISRDKNKILHENETSCLGKLSFMLGEDLIEITKMRVNGKSVIEIRVNKKDLEIKTFTDGKEFVESLIHMPFDVWMNSVFFGQNTSNLFLEGSSKQRSDLVGAILNFRTLDNALKYVRERKKQTATELALLDDRAKLLDAQLDSYKTYEGYEVEEDTVNELEIKRMDVSDKVATFEGRLKKYQQEVVEWDKANRDLSLKKANLTGAQSNYKSVMTRYRAKVDAIKVLAAKAEEQEKAKVDYENKQIRLKELNKELDQLKAQYQEKNALLSAKIEIIAEFKDKIKIIEGESQCPLCRQSVTYEHVKTFNKELKIEIDKANTFKMEREKIGEKVITVKLQVQELSEVYFDDEYYYKVKNCQGQYKELVAEANETKSNLLQLIEGAKKQYEIQQQFVSELKPPDTYKITTIEKTLNDARGVMGHLAQVIGGIKEAVKRKSELLKKAKLTAVDQVAALGNLTDYERMEHVFGVAGVRKFLIDRIVPSLQNKMNSYLNSIDRGDMDVVFSNDDKFDLDVLVRGVSRPVQLFSGGEDKLLSVLFHLALSDVIMERGLDVRFQVLDESFDNLDTFHSSLLVELFNKIARERGKQLFLITHNSMVRDLIEAHCVGKIICKKVGGVSTVN